MWASSTRAGPSVEELEAAAGLFAKEVEVAARPFVKGVVEPVCKEDGVCAFVLSPAQRTGSARLSCRWRQE